MTHSLVAPPLIALGFDGAGSMLYGLPPVRISQECGRCARWLDSSEFRPLAAACRPCQDSWQGREQTKPPHKRQGCDPTVQNRSGAGQKASSEPPLAPARFPPLQPSRNQPCKAPEGSNQHIFEQFIAPDEVFIGPDRSDPACNRRTRNETHKETDRNDDRQ
jgi:hypothetical protein